jgi:hypothetical protein
MQSFSFLKMHRRFEKCKACLFRTEEQARQQSACWRLTLISCLAYSQTMKMEAIYFPKRQSTCTELQDVTAQHIEI